MARCEWPDCSLGHQQRIESLPLRAPRANVKAEAHLFDEVNECEAEERRLDHEVDRLRREISEREREMNTAQEARKPWALRAARAMAAIRALRGEER